MYSFVFSLFHSLCHFFHFLCLWDLSRVVCSFLFLYRSLYEYIAIYRFYSRWTFRLLFVFSYYELWCFLVHVSTFCLAIYMQKRNCWGTGLYLCSDVADPAKQLSKVVVPVSTDTSNVWAFQFYILINTWCCQAFVLFLACPGGFDLHSPDD